MPVRIGFETSGLNPGFKAHAHRGIGRYIRELASQFDRLGVTGEGGRVRVVPFDRYELRSSSRALQALTSLSNLTPIGRTTLTQQVSFPLQLKGAGFDAVHFPAHMDAPAWGLRGYILTVLDLIPLVCADLYKAARSGARFTFARFLELQAIKNASLILAISENTAKDVHRILGVPRERLIVTPLGVDEKFFETPAGKGKGIREKLGLPEARPIVLYVGGIDPRKNISFLLKVFREVLSLGQGVKPVLAMSGNISSDREFPALTRAIRELGLASDVKLLGFVTDDDLRELYTESSAFFFPSLYEGFGLPVLEAMAAGLPVVSSNSSCMPEVVGDAGLTFNPHSTEEAVRALRMMLDDGTMRGEYRNRGRVNARRFTWEQTAKLTLQAYERFSNLDCPGKVMSAAVKTSP